MQKPENEHLLLRTITVGERGQIVIPADMRKELEIQPGDELVAMSHPEKNAVMIFKIDDMRGFISRLSEELGKVKPSVEPAHPRARSPRTSAKGLAWLMIPLLSFAMLTSGARANADKMSIDDAVAVALKNNPNIAIAKSTILKAKADVGIALAAYNPTVNVSGNYTHYEPASSLSIPGTSGGSSETFYNPQNTAGATISGNLPLDFFAANRIAKSVARLAVASSTYTYNATVNDLIRDSKSAYFDVLKAQGGVGVETEEIASLQGHLKDTESALKAGSVSRYDVLRAQTRLEAARLRMITAQNALKNAQAAFNNVLNRPVDTPVDLIDTGRPIFVTVDRDSAINSAVTNNPNVGAIAKEVIARRKNVTYQGINGRAPKISIQPSYDINATPSLLSSGPNSFVTMFVATVPIFDGGLTDADVKDAKSDLMKAKAQQEQIVAGVALNAQSAWLAVQTQQESVNSAKVGLDEAKEAFRLVGLRYKAGVATQTDLLDGQSDLTLANTSYVNALYDYQIALANLEDAVGGPAEFAKLAGK
jgi:AbrB family looped-hinge helix DNA binding protein